MPGLRLLWVCLALLLALSDARAEAPVPAEGQVVRVLVEGNRRIEEAAVLAAVGIRRGEQLTAAKVRRDIKSVYRTGFFDDVRVDLIQSEGGVTVTFIVAEKPAIRDVRIDGQKKVEEEDIREVIDIRAFSVLNDADVTENVQRIRDLYIEKGFFLAEIEADIQYITDDQVELVFVITENRKVVVQRVEISGNDNVPDNKIKRFMQVKEGGIAPWLTSTGTFRRDYLEMDMGTIKAVFMEEGYVDAQIDPPKVYLSPDKRYIYISIHVDEGERYDIGEIDAVGDFIEEEGLTRGGVFEIIGGRQVVDVQEDQWREANGLPPRALVIEQPGPRLRPGDPFKYTTLQAVMSAVTDFYSDQGYAFVNVIPQTRTNPESRTVDVTFDIDTGEKLRIGRINLTGNDPTFDKVIRRELLIEEGSIYRGSRIQASRARLERLGYFDEVNISTPRGDGPEVLDLNIQVSEQPTGSFSLGLGFSNLENFVFTGNISKNNFLGLGYTMSAAINVSSLRQQGQLSLFDPYFLDSRWTLKVDAYSTNQQYILNEYQRGASIAIGRYLDPRDDWRLTLDYTLEDRGLNTLDTFRERIYGGRLYRNGVTSQVGVSLTMDKRNNRIMATKGVYAVVSAQLAGGFRINEEQTLNLLGGDFNFVELRGNFRLYQPIIPNNDTVVFRVNSTIGAIFSTDGQMIPWIHRFRAGGINSVRGYNWFSLGPTLRNLETEDPTRADDQVVVGGTQTWINNFEIESDIVRAAGIKGVVFFDAGNAFGDTYGGSNLNPLDLRFAVGVGVRWRSPIGPLRFEWGFPIAPREGERKSVFDFSIGSFF